MLQNTPGVKRIVAKYPCHKPCAYAFSQMKLEPNFFGDFGGFLKVENTARGTVVSMAGFFN